jgi:hypothetical protein
MEHLAFEDGRVEDHPGNVCEPAPPFDRRRGDWHQTEHRLEGLKRVATLPTQLWSRD